MSLWKRLFGKKNPDDYTPPPDKPAAVPSSASPVKTDPKPAFARDRVVRVFISSTFRDMQDERDLLIKKIFPQLHKLCEERAVTWTEVDLRWGITTEESAEGKVLPLFSRTLT